MKLRMILLNLNNDNLKILYEEYRKPIFLFILSMVKNNTLAEDLTEEVYIRIIKYHDTYKPIYNPKTWIFQIAKNVFYTYLNKQKEISMEDNILNLLCDSKYATNLDESFMIREYLSNLNEIDRNIILLHIFGGLKHYEIAKILGLTHSNVKAKYRAAIQKLQKELNNEKNRK